MNKHNILLLSAIFLIMSTSSLFGHGSSVHTSLYNRVLNFYLENYGETDTYYMVLNTYPEYFKYGSTLPDMQYVNAVKQSMQEMYNDVNDVFTCDITYQINMSDVPDPDGPNGSYSFGINTHNQLRKNSCHLVTEELLPI
ncbi:MAG: hypothetical protein WC155_07275 [Candidatus Cloacimonadales bacterium]